MIDPITAASSVATVKIFTDVVTHLLKKLADLAIEKKERERLKKNPTQGYRTQSTVKRTRSDKLIEGIAERINPWINKHNFNNSAESYVKSLDDLHGHIRVIGMDGPIPLIYVYTKVNILNRPRGYNIPDNELAEKLVREECPYEYLSSGQKLDGLKILEENNRLFILGSPGAGKTTFLKHIMQLAFKGDLKVKYGHEVLPIFIELKNYANEGKFANVMDYIIEQFDICQFPGARPFIEAVLHQGKAIVLCDGLLNRRI